MTNLDSILKSRDITLPTKVHLVKAMVFPVVLYGCESWTIKKVESVELRLWTVVLEKTLESPLDCKIKPVNPKGNQSWIFTGRTDVEAETPTVWPPDAKNWLIWKDYEIKPTWSWCMIFLICCWILFARILLRIFVSMFISDIGL